jgi:hypothetical protein
LVLHAAFYECRLLPALRDSGGKVVGITWFEDGVHCHSATAAAAAVINRLSSKLAELKQALVAWWRAGRLSDWQAE